MVQDVEGFHTEHQMELLIYGETALDRCIERVKSRASHEVSPECALANGNASARIGRYKSKRRWVQSPISRNWLPVDICRATVQIDGNAGNQIRDKAFVSPVGKDDVLV